jgi:hypothetical protein
LFALLAERATSERAIPARESVPFEPDIARLEGALWFAFVLLMPDAPVCAWTAPLPDVLPEELAFCVAEPLCVAEPFCVMEPVGLLLDVFIPLADDEPFCMPEPFAAPFIWLVAGELSVPDCVPVPAAMTGAASNPNAHAETSSPAFIIDRIPSCWIAGGLMTPAIRH